MARTGKPAMSQADHEEVSAAIAAAEALTAGEIVTVVAPCSDTYRDVTLHYAVLAMLAVPATLALLPQSWIDRLSGLLLGWNEEWTRGGLMIALAVLLALFFLIGRLLFSWTPLLTALTPGATKSRRVRRRAIAHFRSACEGRTTGRTGILIYLSLMERRAEIVADRAINDEVDGELWGEAMAGLIDEVRAGRTGRGMAHAVEKVGAVLAEHLPRSQGDTNELPDRLIEL
jgi:putative membrane protein